MLLPCVNCLTAVIYLSFAQREREKDREKDREKEESNLPFFAENSISTNDIILFQESTRQLEQKCIFNEMVTFAIY